MYREWKKIEFTKEYYTGCPRRNGQSLMGADDFVVLIWRAQVR